MAYHDYQDGLSWARDTWTSVSSLTLAQPGYRVAAVAHVPLAREVRCAYCGGYALIDTAQPRCERCGASNWRTVKP